MSIIDSIKKSSNKTSSASMSSIITDTVKSKVSSTSTGTIISAVKDNLSIEKLKESTNATNVQTKISEIKEKAKATAKEKLNTVLDILKENSSEIISKGIDTILQNPFLTTLNKTATDAVLAPTLTILMNAGSDPLYNKGFCIKELIKRDYIKCIEAIMNKKNYNITQGSNASYFNAVKYGATDCAIYILKKKAEIKGEDWYQKNRYAEVKNIIVNCEQNFTSNKILSLINTGYTGNRDDGYIQYNKNDYENPLKYYKQKCVPSGWGENGCDEFKCTFKFSTSEINAMFPEKSTSFGVKATYPRTTEHVKLFKENLMSSSEFGDDKLKYDELYDRLFNNLIVNPVIEEGLEISEEIAKETGIDKLNPDTSKDSAMYAYINWLITNEYI